MLCVAYEQKAPNGRSSGTVTYFIAKDSLPIYVVYVTVFAKMNHLGANLDLGFAYDLNVLFFLFTTHVTVLR